MLRSFTLYFVGTIGPLLLLSFATAAQTTPEAVVRAIAPGDAVAVGDVVEVLVTVENVRDLGAFEFTLDFNDGDLVPKGVEEGDFLKTTNRESVCSELPRGKGTLALACVTLGADPLPPSGNGVLAKVTFEARQAGTSRLTLRDVKLATPPGDEITVQTSDSELKVRGDAGTHIREIAVAVGLGSIVAASIGISAILIVRRRRSGKAT